MDRREKRVKEKQDTPLSYYFHVYDRFEDFGAISQGKRQEVLSICRFDT